MSSISTELKVPVKLTKTEGKFSLSVGSKKMSIPETYVKNPLSMFDDSDVDGTLTTQVIFEAKHKKNKKIEVITEGDSAMTISNPEFSFDSHVELNSDFLSDAGFYAQGDLFEPALVEILESKLSLGEFAHLVSRENIDWDKDETMVAFGIYLASDNCNDRDLVIRFCKAIAVDVKNSDEMSKEDDQILAKIYENNESGMLKINQRSFNSIKLKVFTFPALDNDAEQQGLKNVSKVALEIIEEYRRKNKV